MATQKNKSFVLAGVSINVFVNANPVSVVSNVNVSIRRDIQPVYAMFGTPNPIAFAYNVRRVGGMMEFIALDGYGAMSMIPKDYLHFMSLTEGLEITDAAGNEIYDESEYDRLIGDGKTVAGGSINGVTFSQGESNYANVSRANAVMTKGLSDYLNGSGVAGQGITNFLYGADVKTPGIAAFTAQRPVYLDQAMNLHTSFFALQEGSGFQYSRHLQGLVFHTHNIAIGTQVGAIEEGHYYASNISPWKKSVSLTSDDNKTAYIFPTKDNPFGTVPKTITGAAGYPN